MSAADLPEGFDVWRALLIAAPPSVTFVLVALSQIDETTARIVGGFLSDPVGFVREVAAGFIWDLATSFVRLAVDFILFMLLGGDRAPGLQEGPLGLFDVVIVPLQIGTAAGQLVLRDLTIAVAQLNQSIAATIAPLGLAAFPIVNALIVLEVGLALVISYLMIQGILEVASAIDVPFIDTGEIIEAIRRAAGAVIGAVAGIFGRLR